MYETFNGEIEHLEGLCQLGGTTFEFTASGIATGPYPGNFTETGTVTFGPATSRIAIVPVNYEARIRTSHGAYYDRRRTGDPLGVLRAGGCHHRAEGFRRALHLRDRL